MPLICGKTRGTRRPLRCVDTRDRLTEFLQDYLPLFYREEQRTLDTVVLQDKLCSLQRKTSEPIAFEANRERKPVQHFVAVGHWDHETVMAELRRQVWVELDDMDAVLIVDGSVFPKKGRASSDGNGAGDWAKSTSVRSMCLWPMRQ